MGSRTRSRGAAALFLLVMIPGPGISAQIKGPLRVNPANPRYFTDGTGRAVLLAGSHTWGSMFDQGPGDPPPPFNITQFCEFLKAYGHNCTRTFVWEQSRRGTWISDTNYWFHPPPRFKRTGPGLASDGKPKWNLDSLDESYFTWIKTRIDTFAARGFYVSIELFDGWSVAQPSGQPGNPWLDHPMRAGNNVNGIDGHNGAAGPNGEATQSLLIPAIWPIQERYVKKMVDELDGYDNILYEISNESWSGSQDWQYRVIDTIKAYELRKPKQHPVGMSVEYPGGDNAELFASHADWISVNGTASNGYDYRYNPPPNDGSKVILNDTDHLWGNGGDATWVWESFTRGLNVLYMDGYDGKAYGTGHPWTQADSANGNTVKLRKNMGYILRYANRMNLAATAPRGDLTSTGYCLANPAPHAAEYMVYFPFGGAQTVNLSATSDSLVAEWLNPGDGSTTAGGVVAGGSTRTFTPPFNSDAALYLHSSQTSGIGTAPATTIPAYHLSVNYPNPFNPSTVITYELPARARLTLRIYNAAGQLLRTLLDAVRPAGQGSVTWDGKDGAGEQMSSGSYFCRMTANDYASTVKMLLLR